MNEKNSHIQRLFSTGILGFLKLPAAGYAVNTVRALYEGGIRVIEFSMVMGDCLKALMETKKVFGSSMSIGIGTVLDADSADQAINAGADFIVSPFEVKEVLNFVQKNNIPMIPGAMTPGEVFRAYSNGAEIIKLFPGGILGANYIKALKAPYPNIPLMPDGGVNLSNAEELMRAGSAALGVGSGLVQIKSIESGDFAKISEIAEKFLAIIHKTNSHDNV